MREERRRFGQWLVGEGILTPDQLQEGLRSQAVYGGRLGTNLIEIGYLGLDELAEQLTRFHGLPLAPTQWLESPEEKAVKLVPMALIRRLKVLPLHLDPDAIHVAMLDPEDPEHLDFVETAACRRVVPYVLPEIRLLYWLETHLQIDRHPRFVNLAARLRRTDMKLSDAELSNLGQTFGQDGSVTPASGQSVELAAPAPEPDVLDQWFEDEVLRPECEPGPCAEGPTESADPDDDAEEVLLLEELAVDVEAPPTDSSAPAAGGPLTPTRVAELEARLMGASERDAIVEGVLELARAYCEVAVLFLVHGGKVAPLRASGADVPARLSGLEVPLDVHSIFAHPAVTGFAFRGSPPEGGIDGRLLAGLGRDDVHDLLVQPIRIGERVVNLLYCDNGSSAFGESGVAALGAVADCGARAYERLILDRKRKRAG